MDFTLAFRKIPVLIRCTHCNYELELRPKGVRRIERQNRNDPICPIQIECDICHIGFMIPVKHTGKDGKLFLFDEIKPKIKNLNPNTVMDRIFREDSNVKVMFFGPEELMD